MKAVVLLLGLVACETPNPKIVYVIADGASQSCGSSSCADVKVPCEAAISIRILRPSDPTAPPVTICEPLPQNKNKDLCAISSVDLSDRPIELPKETHEVQMLIWALDDVRSDVNPNELDCGKHDVSFDAVAGFPIAQAPSPAIGGHTYYHPGDEEIRVTLGCTDLPALRTCDLSTETEFTATVENFDNLGVLVSVAQGMGLSVDIGEPKLRGADLAHSLLNEDLTMLSLNATDFGPVWKATFEPEFTDKACVQVLASVAQSTAALRCYKDNIPPITDTLTLRSVFLPKPTLDEILTALALSQFPPNGITIGIVVDSLFNPVPGATVTTNPPYPVRYLSADRMNANGAMTSNNGIFIAQTAPFGTEFFVPGSQSETGGLVRDKVTVVVIKK